MVNVHLVQLSITDSAPGGRHTSKQTNRVLGVPACGLQPSTPTIAICYYYSA